MFADIVNDFDNDPSGVLEGNGMFTIQSKMKFHFSSLHFLKTPWWSSSFPYFPLSFVESQKKKKKRLFLFS